MSLFVCQAKKFTKVGVRGMQVHNQRESENSKNEDIDPLKTELNYDLANPENISYTQKVNEIMKDGYTKDTAPKKDAIQMVSVLISSDKEFFDRLTPEQTKQFFQISFDFLKEQYGEKNTINGMVHMDEKTPHMTFQYVPLTDDGRLCAKEVNNRQALLKMQDGIPKLLQEAGFDIRRGESSKNKHLKHKDSNEYKLEQLLARGKELEVREQEFNAKEKLINRSLVEVARISIKEDKIHSIIKDVRDNKNMLGRPTGEVIMDKADFDQLKLSASAGAIALEENNKLHTQVDRFRTDSREYQMQNFALEKDKGKLQEKINSYDKLMTDRQIQSRVQDIQNPHLAVYRELKKEIPSISYGREMNQHEEIAYKMMQDSRFDRGQIQEALRTDLPRDKAQDALSAASTKINQDQIRQKAEQQVAQERAQTESQRQKTLAINRQKVEDHQKYLKDHPEFSKYIEQRSKGMCDTDIAFRMRHQEKPAIAEYKIINAIVKGGQTKDYAEKCLREVNKIKIPTKAQEKSTGIPARETVNKALSVANSNVSPSFSGGGGGGGGGNILGNLLRPSAPSPSLSGPGMQANCFPFDEDELEQMQNSMERSHSFSR